MKISCLRSVWVLTYTFSFRLLQAPQNRPPEIRNTWEFLVLLVLGFTINQRFSAAKQLQNFTYCICIEIFIWTWGSSSIPLAWPTWSHQLFLMANQSQSSHSSVITSYLAWFIIPSAEKWYLWKDPSRQTAAMWPELTKAQMQAHSWGTVKLANDHWDPA